MSVFTTISLYGILGVGLLAIPVRSLAGYVNASTIRARTLACGACLAVSLALLGWGLTHASDMLASWAGLGQLLTHFGLLFTLVQRANRIDRQELAVRFK